MSLTSSGLASRTPKPPHLPGQPDRRGRYVLDPDHQWPSESLAPGRAHLWPRSTTLDTSSTFGVPVWTRSWSPPASPRGFSLVPRSTLGLTGLVSGHRSRRRRLGALPRLPVAGRVRRLVGRRSQRRACGPSTGRRCWPSARGPDRRNPGTGSRTSGPVTRRSWWPNHSGTLAPWKFVKVTAASAREADTDPLVASTLNRFRPAVAEPSLRRSDRLDGGDQARPGRALARRRSSMPVLGLTYSSLSMPA